MIYSHSTNLGPHGQQGAAWRSSLASAGEAFPPIRFIRTLTTQPHLSFHINFSSHFLPVLETMRPHAVRMVVLHTWGRRQRRSVTSRRRRPRPLTPRPCCPPAVFTEHLSQGRSWRFNDDKMHLLPSREFDLVEEKVFADMEL